MKKIYWIWIKQFSNNDNDTSFINKIKWLEKSNYSFFVVKIWIKDLVKLASKYPLEDSVTFSWEKIDLWLNKWKKSFLWELDIVDLEDPENFILNQIQRSQRKTRLIEIWKYLRYSNFPYFPTSVVWAINWEDSIWFNSLWNDIFEIDLTDKPVNSIFIVDWQHRLLGSVLKYDDLPDEIIENDKSLVKENINWVDYVFANEKMEIMLTLLVNFPLELQANIFQTINFYSKPISPSMYYNLFNFASLDISWSELSHSIIMKLKELDEKKNNSIWSKIFLSEYHKLIEKQNWDKNNSFNLTISQSSLAEKIELNYERWNLFYFYTKEEWQYPWAIYQEKDYDKYFIEWEIIHYNNIKEKLSNILDIYFSIIWKVYGDDWNSPSTSQLSKTTWISVFMNIFPIILSLSLVESKVTVNSLDDIKLNEDFVTLIITDIFKDKKCSFTDLWGAAWLWIQSTITNNTKNILKEKYKNLKDDFYKIIGSKVLELWSDIYDDTFDNFNQNNIRRVISYYIKKNLKVNDNWIKCFIPDENYYILSIAYILKWLEK